MRHLQADLADRLNLVVLIGVIPWVCGRSASPEAGYSIALRRIAGPVHNESTPARALRDAASAMDFDTDTPSVALRGLEVGDDASSTRSASFHQIRSCTVASTNVSLSCSHSWRKGVRSGTGHRPDRATSCHAVRPRVGGRHPVAQVALVSMGSYPCAAE